MAPAKDKRRTRRPSLVDSIESQGLHGESPPLHPRYSLHDGKCGGFHILCLSGGPDDVRVVQTVKGTQAGQLCNLGIKGLGLC